MRFTLKTLASFAVLAITFSSIPSANAKEYTYPCPPFNRDDCHDDGTGNYKCEVDGWTGKVKPFYPLNESITVIGGVATFSNQTGKGFCRFLIKDRDSSAILNMSPPDSLKINDTNCMIHDSQKDHHSYKDSFKCT